VCVCNITESSNDAQGSHTPARVEGKQASRQEARTRRPVRRRMEWSSGGSSSMPESCRCCNCGAIHWSPASRALSPCACVNYVCVRARGARACTVLMGASLSLHFSLSSEVEATDRAARRARRAAATSPSMRSAKAMCENSPACEGDGAAVSGSIAGSRWGFSEGRSFLLAHLLSHRAAQGPHGKLHAAPPLPRPTTASS
jgi:hypothetical protein